MDPFALCSFKSVSLPSVKAVKGIGVRKGAAVLLGTPVELNAAALP